MLNGRNLPILTAQVEQRRTTFVSLDKTIPIIPSKLIPTAVNIKMAPKKCKRKKVLYIGISTSPYYSQLNRKTDTSK